MSRLLRGARVITRATPPAGEQFAGIITLSHADIFITPALFVFLTMILGEASARPPPKIQDVAFDLRLYSLAIQFTVTTKTTDTFYGGGKIELLRYWRRRWRKIFRPLRRGH